MSSPDAMGIGNDLNLIYYSIQQNTAKLQRIDPTFTAPTDWQEYTISLLTKYIHESQFPINYQRPSSIFEGATVLMYACRYKRLHIVQYLIEHGADTTLHHALLAQYNSLTFALIPFDLQYDDNTIHIINLLLTNATPILPTAYTMFFLTTRFIKLTPAYMNIWKVLWQTDPYSIDIRAISIFFSRTDSFDSSELQSALPDPLKPQQSTTQSFKRTFASPPINKNSTLTHTSSASKKKSPFSTIFDDIFSTNLSASAHQLVKEQALYIAFAACILADTINIDLLTYLLSLAPGSTFNSLYVAGTSELFKNNPFPIGWHHYPQIQDIYYEHAEPIECQVLHHPTASIVDEIKEDQDGEHNIFTMLLSRHAKQLNYTVLRAVELLLQHSITPPKSISALLVFFQCATLQPQLGMTILQDIKNSHITFESLFATQSDYIAEKVEEEFKHPRLHAETNALSQQHDSQKNQPEFVEKQTQIVYNLPSIDVLKEKHLLRELDQRIEMEFKRQNEQQTDIANKRTQYDQHMQEIKDKALFDILSDQILSDILIKTFLLLFSAYPQLNQNDLIQLALTNLRSLPVDVSLYLISSQNLFNFGDIMPISNPTILGTTYEPIHIDMTDATKLVPFQSPLNDFISGQVSTKAATQTQIHPINTPKISSAYHLLSCNSTSAVASLEKTFDLLVALCYSNQSSFADCLLVLEFLYSVMHIGGFSLATLERRLFRLKSAAYTTHFKSIFHQFYTIHKLSLFLPSSTPSPSSPAFKNIAALYSATSDHNSPLFRHITAKWLSFNLIGPYLFYNFHNTHISNQTFLALMEFVINYQDIAPSSHGDILLPHVTPNDPKLIYTQPISGMRHYSIPTVTSTSKSDIPMLPLIDVHPSTFAFRLWLYLRYCERDAYLQYELTYPSLLSDATQLSTTITASNDLWRNHISNEGHVSNWYNIQRLFDQNATHHELDIYLTPSVPLHNVPGWEASQLYNFYNNRTIYNLHLAWGDLSLLTRHPSFAIDPHANYVYQFIHIVMIKSLRYIAQATLEFKDLFSGAEHHYHSVGFCHWLGLSGEEKSEAEVIPDSLKKALMHIKESYCFSSIDHLFPQIVSFLEQGTTVAPRSSYVPSHTPSVLNDFYYDAGSAPLTLTKLSSPSSHQSYIRKLHSAQQSSKATKQSLDHYYGLYHSIPGHVIPDDFVTNLCSNNPHLPAFLSLIYKPDRVNRRVNLPNHSYLVTHDSSTEDQTQGIKAYNFFQQSLISILFQKLPSYHFYRANYFEFIILSMLKTFVLGFEKMASGPKTFFTQDQFYYQREANFLEDFIWKQLFTLLLIGLTPSNLTTRLHTILYAIEVYNWQYEKWQLASISHVPHDNRNFSRFPTMVLDAFPIILQSMCSPVFRNLIQPTPSPAHNSSTPTGAYLPAYWTISSQTASGFHHYAFFIFQVVRYHPVLSTFFEFVFLNTVRSVSQYYSLSSLQVPDLGVEVACSKQNITLLCPTRETVLYTGVEVPFDIHHFSSILQSYFLGSNLLPATRPTSFFSEEILQFLHNSEDLFQRYPSHQILHIALYLYLATYHPGQTISYSEHSKYLFRMSELAHLRQNYTHVVWDAYCAKHDNSGTKKQDSTSDHLAYTLHHPLQTNLLRFSKHNVLRLRKDKNTHQHDEIFVGDEFDPSLDQTEYHQIYTACLFPSPSNLFDQVYTAAERQEIQFNQFNTTTFHAPFLPPSSLLSNQFSSIHDEHILMTPLSQHLTLSPHSPQTPIDPTAPPPNLCLNFSYKQYSLHKPFYELELTRSGHFSHLTAFQLQVERSNPLEQAFKDAKLQQATLLNPDPATNLTTNVDGTPFSFNIPSHITLTIQTPIKIFEGNDQTKLFGANENTNVPALELSTEDDQDQLAMECQELKSSDSESVSSFTPLSSNSALDMEVNSPSERNREPQTPIESTQLSSPNNHNSSQTDSTHLSYLKKYHPELFSLSDYDYHRFQPYKRTTLRILARIAQLIEKDYFARESSEQAANSGTVTVGTDDIDMLQPSQSTSTFKKPIKSRSKTATATTTTTKSPKSDLSKKSSTKLGKGKEPVKDDQTRLDVNHLSLTCFQLRSVAVIGLGHMRHKDNLASSAAGLRILSTEYWTHDLVDFLAACFSSSILPLSHHTSLLPCVPIAPRAAVTFESTDLQTGHDPIQHCRLHGSLLCHILVRYAHRLIVQRIQPQVFKTDRSYSRKSGPFPFLCEISPTMVYGEHSTPPLQILGRAQTPYNEDLFTSKHVLGLTSLVYKITRAFNYRQRIKGNKIVPIKWRDAMDAFLRTIMLKHAVLGWSEVLLIQSFVEMISYADHSSHYILSLFTHLRNQPHTQLFSSIFNIFLKRPGPNSFEVFKGRSIFDWFLSSTFHPSLETKTHPIPPIIKKEDMDEITTPFKLESTKLLPTAQSTAYYQADSPLSYIVDYIPSLTTPKDRLEYTKLLSVTSPNPVFRSITKVDIDLMTTLLSIGTQPCSTATIRKIYADHCSILDCDVNDNDEYDSDVSDGSDDEPSPLTNQLVQKPTPLSMPTSNQLSALKSTLQPTVQQQSITKLINSLLPKHFLTIYYVDDIQNNIAEFLCESKIESQVYPQFFENNPALKRFLNIYAFYTTIYYPPPMCSTLTTVELSSEEVELIRNHELKQKETGYYTNQTVLIEADLTVVKYVRPASLLYDPERTFGPSEDEDGAILTREQVEYERTNPCQINHNFPLRLHYWGVIHALLHHPDPDLKLHLFGPNCDEIISKMDKDALISLYKMDLHTFIQGPRYDIFFNPVSIEMLTIMDSNNQTSSMHLTGDNQAQVVSDGKSETHGLKGIKLEDFAPCVDLNFYDQHLFAQYYDKYIAPTANLTINQEEDCEEGEQESKELDTNRQVKDDGDGDDGDGDDDTLKKDQDQESHDKDENDQPKAENESKEKDQERENKDSKKDDDKPSSAVSKKSTVCPPLPSRLSGEKLRSISLGWYLMNTVSITIDDFSALLQGIRFDNRSQHDSTDEGSQFLLSPINFHVCNEYNQSLLMFAILRRYSENILSFIVNCLGFDYIFKHYDVYGRNAYYYFINTGISDEIPILWNHIEDQKELYLDYPPIWEKPWP